MRQRQIVTVHARNVGCPSDGSTRLQGSADPRGLLGEDAYPCVCGRQSTENLWRRVRRAVIDYDYFRVTQGLFCDAVDCGREVLLPVSNRHQHADARGRRFTGRRWTLDWDRVVLSALVHG